jgi:pimeloyl-ACP methyl ester carboxylesterase
MKVVFLHGLNTYGDDDLHLGPVRFGPMHGPLSRALEEKGISILPVEGIGARSPEAQAVIAIGFLEREGALSAANKSFHLIGQSAGGLVARVLSHRKELHGRVRSIITIGTPHQGANIASFGLEFEKNHPLLCQLAAICGYDTREKAETFRHYTPEAIAEFNRRFPSLPGVREVCLICDAVASDVSWPLSLRGVLPDSDGFVTCASQRRGDEQGTFSLDHFAALGYFFHLDPAAKKRAAKEFSRLVDAISRACR